MPKKNKKVDVPELDKETLINGAELIESQEFDEYISVTVEELSSSIIDNELRSFLIEPPEQYKRVSIQVASLLSGKMLASPLQMSPVDLADRIIEYFDQCRSRKKSPTVPGIAFHLGFETREQMFSFLRQYSNSHTYLLNRALTFIESVRNEEILAGYGVMAGHKIDLETNFKWAENKEAQPNLNININTGSLPPQLSVDEWQSMYLSSSAQQQSNTIATKAIAAGKRKGRPSKTLPKLPGGKTMCDTQEKCK